MASSNKLADLLHANTDLQDFEVMSHRMMEAATVCDAMYQILSTHKALQKAINAQISASKDIMRHIDNDEVKPAVLMVEPFYPRFAPCQCDKGRILIHAVCPGAC